MRVLVATLLSGLMFHLSMGLSDVWLLAWFAATPLLWLAFGGTASVPLALASFAAFACGQIYMFQCYLGVLPLPALVVFVSVLSALFAVAVLLSRAAMARGWSWAALVAFPAAWTVFEYLFGVFSPHATYAALGYAEVSFPAGVQVAALLGLYSVTFLLCLASSGLALLLRGRLRPGLAAVGICALAVLFGAVRLALPQPSGIRVAALADQDGWRQQRHDRTVAGAEHAAQAYAQAITRLAGAQVVVIPETAIRVPEGQEGAVLAGLADAARQSGAVIVAGTQVSGPSPNRAFSFMPDGSRRIYDKRHLLLGQEPGTPGTEAGVLGDGYAVQICKDMDFPGTVRSTAAHGIRLMVVPANDFGRDGWIHGRMAIMRGVENGFAVLRSAFSGIETISDAYGRVLAQAPTQQAGVVVITAEVPPGPGPTLYTRIGDVFCWLCGAVALLIGASLLLVRRQTRALPVLNEPPVGAPGH